MSGAAICVAHLVWAPLGLAPLERFAGSYRRHPAGAEHRLQLVFNGFDDPAALRSARAVAAGLDAEETVLERPALDLDVYRGVLAATIPTPGARSRSSSMPSHPSVSSSQ